MALVSLAPAERDRFLTLALALFVNTVVVDSNQVLATIQFVSTSGVTNLLWMWALGLSATMVTVGGYSLFVDRTKRTRLVTRMYLGFGAVYAAVFLLLIGGVPGLVAYPLLTIVNNQQWLVFPLALWALANDLFSTAEAKRLFPLLAAVAVVGGIVGNGLAAVAAEVLAASPFQGRELLLFNSGLNFLVAAFLAGRLRRLKVRTRQSRPDTGVLDNLREGFAFVREVPAFRYLSLSMLLLGITLNTFEYQIIVEAVGTYVGSAGLQAFYGAFRAASVAVTLILQGVVTSRLLARLGFKSIFAVMPGAMLAGTLLLLVWPSLIAAALGDFAARVVLSGVDEPGRRAFQGLIPDERRGRVSAFMDGYLYSSGSIVGCALIGAVVVAVDGRLLTPGLGRELYLAISGVAAGLAVWAFTRFRSGYDASMLNWRLRRRRRLESLPSLEF